MRPIWKGSITFGLVNIPVSLYPATRTEDLKFRLLRGSDLSPVNYKRVAEKDGKEVPWEEIVKGYEYEKGKFVVLKEEDFRRVDLEAAAQTVQIEAFVKQEEVNPMFFNKPYYMEPQKGADRAYVLLREALDGTGMIGISRVVIKTREHLAAVKPQDDGLILELMHWASELRDTEEFRQPKEARPGSKELNMAKTLIKSMTEKWDAEAYRDEYREALEEIIQEKISTGSVKAAPKPSGRKAATNVIDLVSVLEESLRKKESGKKSSPAKSPRKSGRRKTAKTGKAA